MKLLLNKTLFGIIIILCIFILGITPCMIISTLIVIFTDAIFQDCIVSIPFIIFSIIGMIGSSIYITEEIKHQ